VREHGPMATWRIRLGDHSGRQIRFRATRQGRQLGPGFPTRANHRHRSNCRDPAGERSALMAWSEPTARTATLDGSDRRSRRGATGAAAECVPASNKRAVAGSCPSPWYGLLGPVTFVAPACSGPRGSATTDGVSDPFRACAEIRSPAAEQAREEARLRAAESAVGPGLHSWSSARSPREVLLSEGAQVAGNRTVRLPEGSELSV
jgi:hypothetical protein